LLLLLFYLWRTKRVGWLLFGGWFGTRINKEKKKAGECAPFALDLSSVSSWVGWGFVGALSFE
jgi:hypothetical protein